MLWFAISVCAAQTPELEATIARAARERARLRFLQQELSRTAEDIVELEAAIADREQEIERLAREASEIERRIEARHRDLEAVARDLDAVRARASRRALAVLRSKDAPIDMLIDGRDFETQRRMRDRMAFVLAHDAEVARMILRLQAKRRAAVDALERQRAALSDRMARPEAEAHSLALARAERSALAQAVGEERDKSRRLNALLHAARERQQTASLAPVEDPEPALGAFEAQRGRLPWPVRGRVEVPFGVAVDPFSGVILEQPGVDLRVPFGTEVRAPFFGEVAWLGLIPGRGRVLILRHPVNGVTTYAHLDAIAVELGERVDRLQTIGRVGSTGSPKGAFLYFEVRLDGAPVDPIDWLAR